MEAAGEYVAVVAAEPGDCADRFLNLTQRHRGTEQQRKSPLPLPLCASAPLCEELWCVNSLQPLEPPFWHGLPAVPLRRTVGLSGAAGWESCVLVRRDQETRAEQRTVGCISAAQCTRHRRSVRRLVHFGRGGLMHPTENGPDVSFLGMGFVQLRATGGGARGGGYWG
jgi:hypothetical protein